MHSTTSYTASGNSEESGAFPGFDMAYGGNLFYLGRARIGWDLGFGFLPISITDKASDVGERRAVNFCFQHGWHCCSKCALPGRHQSARRTNHFHQFYCQ
jgi:hypothetical protein